MPKHHTPITHVIQLMLENRSFDQMLGLLYEGKKTPAGVPFEGLTGMEANPDGTGRKVTITRIGAGTPNPYHRPGADPGEGYYNTNLQLFSTEHPAAGAKVASDGFVTNFKTAIAYDAAHGYKDSLPGTGAGDIMEAYPPEMLPIMSTLAKKYAVCDHWFASAPTQTIPNRAFAGAATSLGHLDNHVKIMTCPSIYGRLSNAGLDWAIFGYDRAPLTRTDFPDTLNADPAHFGLFKDFKARAAAGTLPAYTFLEPSFGASGNSQHPNYDVAKGEQLIADVYRALHDGPGWNGTLLIITYDEHGGNYDHVAPPANAVAPDGSVGEFDGFDFTRFGVRVPAILVSPLIAEGTVHRAARGTIDHTSVLKTIAEIWKLKPLTQRDAHAPSLLSAVTLAKPRTDDALSGILPPVALTQPGDQHQPSELERIHAWRLSALPLPDERGFFAHQPPDLSTSAAIGDYIAGRSALWDQHLLARMAAARRPSRAPG